ncbi:carbohydrate kinase [Jatrophihabitans telluris]|uniref:Carbohydrate kinase n=1 Tax=Jatrophihabitans telluris TaxID=2038343 RepID=A0ABY4QSR7_9ACTN|nr:carbohydrate kinase [Jatrophihabitans telluris]UQX86665.1 carbohydrate kinase [Jatrophihabitans telluris]
MVCVIGEALIDLVAEAGPGTTLSGGSADGARLFRAHPGGSPFNVAVGLARLGQVSRLQARLGSDAFGRQLRAHALANGVDLSLAVDAAEPTTLAIVGLDEQRNATYDFYLNGTADWQWTAEELNRADDASAPADWVHTGSLASWTDPGAAVIGDHLSRIRQTRPTVVSYDPNIRPLLMPDHPVAVARVEASVALAHVVKASAEDLEWLYPGREVSAILQAWRDLGPSLVVVTDGGKGAHAIAGEGELLSVPARPITVVDTVGAGDAFMAGLVNALVRTRLLPAALTADSVRPVLAEAILVAALTCSRAGANPPTAAELMAATILS